MINPTITRLSVLAILSTTLGCGQDDEDAGSEIRQNFAAVDMSPLRFDGKIPVGKELDPVEIWQARGVPNIPNADTVERYRSKYESAERKFDGLNPRSTEVEVLEVALSNDAGVFAPPDMGGIGPFVVLRFQDEHFVMTKGNFSQLYRPVTRETLMPYLRAYHKLFMGGRLSGIVEERDDRGNERDPPPETTSFRETDDGFIVDLVTFTSVHWMHYSKVQLRVDRNGTVKSGKWKMLKDLGPGIVF